MMRTTFTFRLVLLALVVFSLLSISLVTAQEQPTPSPTPELQPTPIVVPEGWTLVWHDEFDGDTIDEANWTYDLGAGGWGNGEAQYYTDRPENARLEDGLLVIEARQERYEEAYYTSARLKTQGLQEFQYGRIEARLKVPAGKGLWPAFWMLGSNFETVGWPDCGEIDIMEYIGREPDLILGTIHGPGYSGALGLSKWNRRDYPIADDFHTYAVEWDENQITWFYDGVEYGAYTRSDVGERDWPFDQPFFIILNLALGGQFPGPIGLDTVFPKQYLVDYVRVFQQA
jgi:beta-glucanase (GH16 family)